MASKRILHQPDGGGLFNKHGGDHLGKMTTPWMAKMERVPGTVTGAGTIGRASVMGSPKGRPARVHEVTTSSHTSGVCEHWAASN